MPPKLTPEIISAAIDGYEAQKTSIDGKIAELRALLPGGSPEPAVAETTGAAPQRKRRKFSPAAVRRMREAQQRRWAKVRGESEPSAPTKPEAPKPKRRISKEGMARIIAATKKRWRLQKAAPKAAKAQPPSQRRRLSKKLATKAAVRKAAVRKTAPAPARSVTFQVP